MDIPMNMDLDTGMDMKHVDEPMVRETRGRNKKQVTFAEELVQYDQYEEEQQVKDP